MDSLSKKALPYPITQQSPMTRLRIKRDFFILLSEKEINP